MIIFTNWCTYLLVLESTKIYLKFTLKFLPNFLKIVTLTRFKYELPDDGHRPKNVGAF